MRPLIDPDSVPIFFSTRFPSINSRPWLSDSFSNSSGVNKARGANMLIFNPSRLILRIQPLCQTERLAHKSGLDMSKSVAGTSFQIAEFNFGGRKEERVDFVEIAVSL